MSYSPMSFPLSSLPAEIITIIAESLSADDILNLGECGIDVVVTKAVYHHAFHDDTHYSHYDLEMFRERAGSNLFLIGDRIYADKIATVPRNYEYVPEEFTKDGKRVWPLKNPEMRMHTPLKVDSRETIVQVGLFTGSSGRWAGILNSQNDVYLGSSIGYDHCALKDYTFRKTTARECLKPFRRTHFVDFFTGECCAFALDDNGLLWQWFRGWHSTQAIPLLCEGSMGHDISGKRVLRIRQSGMYIVCLVEDEGIMRLRYEYDRNSDAPNLWQDGYPTFNGGFHTVFMEPIIGHQVPVKDFVVLGGHVIVLSTAGFVSFLGLREFISDGKNVCHKLNQLGPFVHLSGVFPNLGLLTTTGHVVTMNMDIAHDRSAICVIDSLPKAASLSVCEDHIMALSEEGDVYVWGKEVGCNGSLGLGKMEEALKLPSVQLRSGSLVVDKPTKLNLPGKAYAIFTTSKGSAVLIYEPKEEERKRKRRRVDVIGSGRTLKSELPAFHLNKRLDMISDRIDHLEGMLKKQAEVTNSILQVVEKLQKGDM